MADVSVSLDLDAKQLYNELQQASQHLVQFASKAKVEGEAASKGFASSFSGIGNSISGAFGSFGGLLGPLAAIFSVAGIEQAIKSTVEYGTRVEDLSRRFGVASQTIQKFGNAAELNGSSLEAMAKGFRFLEVSQAKALEGSTAHIKAFEGLNVSIKDLQTLRPDELMLKLGQSSLNAADTVKVLGRSALELRPTLAGLADGTIQFGEAISDIDTGRLKEADDFFKKMGQDIKIVSATVLAELIPAIASLEGALSKPSELIHRFLDVTPTGAAAAPEDTALAKQIHDSRESDAGKPLPAELDTSTAAEEKKRRDFGEPPEGEGDSEGGKKVEAQEKRIAEEQRKLTEDYLSGQQKVNVLIGDAARLQKEIDDTKADKERNELILKRLALLREIKRDQDSVNAASTAKAAEREGIIQKIGAQTTLQGEIERAQQRVNFLETPAERIADFQANQGETNKKFYDDQKKAQDEYAKNQRLARPDLFPEEHKQALEEAKSRLGILKEGAAAADKAQEIRSEPIERLLEDIKNNTADATANK